MPETVMETVSSVSVEQDGRHSAETSRVRAGTQLG